MYTSGVCVCLTGVSFTIFVGWCPAMAFSFGVPPASGAAAPAPGAAPAFSFGAPAAAPASAAAPAVAFSFDGGAAAAAAPAAAAPAFDFAGAAPGTRGLRFALVRLMVHDHVVVVVAALFAGPYCWCVSHSFRGAGCSGVLVWRRASSRCRSRCGACCCCTRVFVWRPWRRGNSNVRCGAGGRAGSSCGDARSSPWRRRVFVFAWCCGCTCRVGRSDGDGGCSTRTGGACRVGGACDGRPCSGVFVWHRRSRACRCRCRCWCRGGQPCGCSPSACYCRRWDPRNGSGGRHSRCGVRRAGRRRDAHRSLDGWGA